MDSSSILFQAVRAKDLGRIRQWHAHNQTLGLHRENIRDFTDENGFSPPAYAVDDLAITRFFVEECGVDPCGPEGISGQTLVHAASSAGTLDTVRYLVLQCGMEPMTLNGHGQSPCTLNITLNEGNALDFFLNECHVDVDCAQDDRGFTMLHHAVFSGPCALVRRLVEVHHASYDVQLQKWPRLLTSGLGCC